MHRTPPFWFGWPREEISATERARQAAKRASRLEQHMLPARHAGASAPRRQDIPEPPVSATEARDPMELKRGLDVQELSDSAYARLFPSSAASEEVDD